MKERTIIMAKLNEYEIPKYEDIEYVSNISTASNDSLDMNLTKPIYIPSVITHETCNIMANIDMINDRIKIRENTAPSIMDYIYSLKGTIALLNSDMIFALVDHDLSILFHNCTCNIMESLYKEISKAQLYEDSCMIDSDYFQEEYESAYLHARDYILTGVLNYDTLRRIEHTISLYAGQIPDSDRQTITMQMVTLTHTVCSPYIEYCTNIIMTELYNMCVKILLHQKREEYITSYNYLVTHGTTDDPEQYKNYNFYEVSTAIYELADKIRSDIFLTFNNLIYTRTNPYSAQELKDFSK